MIPDIDTYLSLKNISEGLYKEKGSRFLAFVYPTETDEQVKEILDELKKQYYDARIIVMPLLIFAVVLKAVECRLSGIFISS